MGVRGRLGLAAWGRAALAFTFLRYYYENMDFPTSWLGVGGLGEKSLPLAALRLFQVPPETRLSYNGKIYNTKKNYCEKKELID